MGQFVQKCKEFVSPFSLYPENLFIFSLSSVLLVGWKIEVWRIVLFIKDDEGGKEKEGEYLV